jgi:hypothetical protein
MKKIIIIILIGLIAQFVFFLMSFTSVKQSHAFSFMVFGDMPYYMPEDNVRFENAIQYLNKQDQAFNVFVGDFKSSRNACTDEVYNKIYSFFNQFEKPLICTPGDNEWTDCKNNDTTYVHGLQRLDFLRAKFFSDSKSLGVVKMNLNIQSNDSNFKKFTENRQWDFNQVSFATIHVVGSNNNYKKNSLDSNKEFNERLVANLNWLNLLFKNASEKNSKGIVIFIHADMFYEYKTAAGFTVFLNALKSLTIAFKKPVLLVHGDSHHFVVDKPLMYDVKNEKTIINFTRVQVFGEGDMHAVKVIVNPNNPSLFEVQECLVPKNR